MARFAAKVVLFLCLLLASSLALASVHSGSHDDGEECVHCTLSHESRRRLTDVPDLSSEVVAVVELNKRAESKSELPAPSFEAPATLPQPLAIQPPPLVHLDPCAHHRQDEVFSERPRTHVPRGPPVR